MTKARELSEQKSCLNKARLEELIFVLLERDPAAAYTVKQWCKKRIRLGLNLDTDAKIREAWEWADAVENIHRSRRTS